MFALLYGVSVERRYRDWHSRWFLGSEVVFASLWAAAMVATVVSDGVATHGATWQATAWGERWSVGGRCSPGPSRGADPRALIVLGAADIVASAIVTARVLVSPSSGARVGISRACRQLEGAAACGWQSWLQVRVWSRHFSPSPVLRAGEETFSWCDESRHYVRAERRPRSPLFLRSGRLLSLRGNGGRNFEVLLRGMFACAMPSMRNDVWQASVLRCLAASRHVRPLARGLKSLLHSCGPSPPARLVFALLLCVVFVRPRVLRCRCWGAPARGVPGSSLSVRLPLGRGERLARSARRGGFLISVVAHSFRRKTWLPLFVCHCTLLVVALWFNSFANVRCASGRVCSLMR